MVAVFCLSFTNTGCSADKNNETEDKMQWFRDAKFGIFVHWNHISMLAPYIEEEGKVPGEDIEQTKRLPFDRMKEIHKKFNPVNYNADEWLKLFKRSGAKYLTFTTYHTQISMFDNPYTDYDISNTLYKKDIVKEIAEATRREGLKLFWYYGIAQPQWTDYPDGHKDINSPYYDYIYNSVEHLLTNYGKIDGMWWDGRHPYQERNIELIEMAKKHQPHIIMTGRLSREHGDFGTPEQQLGTFNLDWDWESCIPIEGVNWHYYGGKDIKSLSTCLRMLVSCAGGGGNLILNISPMPDGSIQPEQKAVLEGMGKWLDKYGKGIYKTEGGPYVSGNWGTSTRIDDKVYIYLFQQLEDGVLELPALPAKVLNYSLLSEGNCEFEQTPNKFIFSFDKIASNPDVVTVVELKLDKSPMDIDPVKTDTFNIPLTADCEVTASSQKFFITPPNTVIYHSKLDPYVGDIMRQRNEMVEQKERQAFMTKKQNEFGITFKLGPRHFKQRYWMAADDDSIPWIEVNMKEPVTFSQAHILEHHNRIKDFELQYFENNAWVSFYRGKQLNYFYYKNKPITAQRVRILVHETTGGPPAVKMFDLF